MDTYSIIIIVGLVLSVLLGCLLGFGRTIRFFTGGIIGVLFSVFFCFLFGGMIAKLPFVADLIARGDAYFGQKAEILAKIHLSTIIYYVILFFVFQILRIIAVRIIGAIFTPKDKDSKIYGVRNVINRVLGVIFAGAFFVLVVYLIMAILNLLADVESVKAFLQTAQDNNTFFYKMYTHNPIYLGGLFANR